jgi:hypothetical protein
LSKNTSRNTSTSIGSTVSANSQAEKFEQAARERGADEDEARWKERLQKIAKQKPEEPGHKH